jgi:hypothetical protein
LASWTTRVQKPTDDIAAIATDDDSYQPNKIIPTTKGIPATEGRARDGHAHSATIARDLGAGAVPASGYDMTMKDYQASLEKLRKDAAEAALIRDLATDVTKREMFDRLHKHLNRLADEVEAAMKSG